MRLSKRLIAGLAATAMAGSAWGQLTIPVNAGGPIADGPVSGPGTSTFFTFTVGTAGLVTDVNVRLAIDHGELFDISAYLWSPTSTTATAVTLFGALTSKTGTGASSLQDTIIDDAASAPIGNSPNDETAAPWSGSYQPQYFASSGATHKLSDFNGASLAGVWKLEIVDAKQGGIGTLYTPGSTSPPSWGTTIGTSLTFTYVPIPEPSEAAAAAAAALLGFAAWRRRRDR